MVLVACGALTLSARSEAVGPLWLLASWAVGDVPTSNRSRNADRNLGGASSNITLTRERA
jgi:hypothetical protein